jgi:signal transduction histidine kinase
MTAVRVTVLVADDHPLFRDGIVRAVRERPDLELVGEAADGQMALQHIRELRPVVAVLDLALPKLDGLDVLARGVAGADDRARAALDETHRQLREEVFAMHPVGLERAGLAAVLRHLAEAAARRGDFIATVQVDRSAVDARNDLLVSSARELLTNAAKHAHASGVDVTVHSDDGWLRLTVADDGDGFPAERLGQALTDGHIGLAATAERIRAVGGQITIDSTPTAGTTIIATFPAEHPTTGSELRGQDGPLAAGVAAAPHHPVGP